MIESLAARAKAVSHELVSLSSTAKEKVLLRLADELATATSVVVEANRVDVKAAIESAMDAALVDRLTLDEKRLHAVAAAVRDIAKASDPVGRTLHEETRPSGIRIRRVSVPIGVIAIVYESRPNVTVDAAALCLKAGNAVILRGGKEALRTNKALVEVIRKTLSDEGLPADAVQLVQVTDRDAIRELVQQTRFVDLVIPRGGEALIHFVIEHARVPVIQHFKGVCHLYVDEGAEHEAATRLVANGKLTRPGVCNALECLLVHRAEAPTLLPKLLGQLLEQGCAVRGCERTCAIVPQATRATEDDFGREFLDRILAVCVVDSLDDALLHIRRYGSNHTEAICTLNDAHGQRFLTEVDAACVLVNASTRFHDGGELGLGAEIGISTSRLHWRGAMGLEGLTTMKWLVQGDRAGSCRG